MRALLLLLLSATTLHAQWQIQDSHSTASFRGIHALGAGVAWASGTQGTVLRTIDDGKTWQACAVPPDAEKLDFRGIQAFDANTAIVMSSGKGDLSRLYKTTDGCKSWKLVFSNPDREGFWDALRFSDSHRGFLLGDPVDGRFVLFGTLDGGQHWIASKSKELASPEEKTGAFAASNSSMLLAQAPSFGTGGAYFYLGDNTCTMETARSQPNACIENALRFSHAKIPLSNASASAGVFSLAASNLTVIAVGGEYTKPTETDGTAAYSLDLGQNWQAAATPPHGYRSSVAYDATSKNWITVGPNGTDVSTDDGKNWHTLKPSSKEGEAEDADQNWNALSLPFVVGPKGRIGRLRNAALKQ